MTQRMTLFCDASWCPGTRFGGWGAWAKRGGWDSGRFYGGPFKTRFKSSTHAELGAIANAMVRAGKLGWFEGVAFLMIQSDSMNALEHVLDHIEGTRDNPHADGLGISSPTKRLVVDPQVADILAVVASTIELFGLLLEVRHVKGHDGGKHKRSWVNEGCDMIAKQHMRALRTQGSPMNHKKRRESLAARRARLAAETWTS